MLTNELFSKPLDINATTAVNWEVLLVQQTVQMLGKNQITYFSDFLSVNP
jgi:hypothetical protein